MSLEKLYSPGVILGMFGVYVFVNIPNGLLQEEQKYNKSTMAFLTYV